MNIKRIKNFSLIFFTVTILVGSFSIINGVGLMGPGSEDDPIVTLSYVEKRIEQIKYYINQNIETINNSSVGMNSQLQELKAKVEQLNNTSTAESQDKYRVVFVKAGSTIMFGESSEVIWRSGKAAVIASQNGGLSDVTTGVDLTEGVEIPLNHLLIIPRNDGRGASVTVDSYVMIKGAYTIQ
ncbi:hypothetical protein [Paramaledivibacter caminithermalis]|jgi:hypothetical protein|uniref:Uncharacterized protein n=1 Tax=Paramaledivibacter caminithermalis (strain DSM 15212 / CIP 107654 / DViRD3) TaxID=1121301 RepID=A0A1M6KSA8_PARC5|nr:hypothetical protein [Paramaledivibacter caminithermalis]SHJ61823.1 hypothetical protein SAMN02745912_00511 [Paramaledivibacter caminithermalis DSM 15212]